MAQGLFHVCETQRYKTFSANSSATRAGERIGAQLDWLEAQLADGRPDFQANGQQWKTPPLWGIGLIKDVNGHQRLMHDGRARGHGKRHNCPSDRLGRHWQR